MEKFLFYAGFLFVTSTALCKPSTPQIFKDEENAFHRLLEVNSKGEKSEKFSSSEDVQLLEGDIVRTKKLMSLIEQMKTNQSRLSAFDAIRNGAWPNGIVPYLIGPTMTAQDHIAIKGAIAEFEEKTCVRFVPKTHHASYVIFVKKQGCYSLIGKQGGPQEISLGMGCGYKGVAIHEMMHALGFFHEQSRRDRDSYIRVNYQNIMRSLWYNFDMYRDGEASTLGESYDKQSIMHYGKYADTYVRTVLHPCTHTYTRAQNCFCFSLNKIILKTSLFSYAFSTNGQKTIVSLANSNEIFGQRDTLSAIDIKQLNKYYNCKGTTGPSGCEDQYPFCPNISQWCLKIEFVKSNCKKACKTCL